MNETIFGNIIKFDMNYEIQFQYNMWIGNDINNENRKLVLLKIRWMAQIYIINLISEQGNANDCIRGFRLITCSLSLFLFLHMCVCECVNVASFIHSMRLSNVFFCVPIMLQFCLNTCILSSISKHIYLGSDLLMPDIFSVLYTKKPLTFDKWVICSNS